MKTLMFAGICIALLAPSLAWAGKADDTLNIAYTTDITTMDNYKESSREGLTLIRLLFDNLLEKDPDTGEFMPALAESWSQIDDVTLEFVIREGVRFHDGSLLTVDDVVYTLQKVTAEDYAVRWPISTEWIADVVKVDDRTVRITMKEPGPLALEMLSGNLAIYPQEYYERVGPEGMGINPIGTGPYKAVEVVPGSHFVFERNDDYFEDSPRRKPAIRHLNTRLLPEMNTQYVELMNGGLDWVWRVPPSEAAMLESNPNIQMRSTAIVRFAFMQINPNFNGGDSPVGDERVRRALIHAIDRESIREAFVGGSSEVIHSPCSPSQFGCAGEVAELAYDPELARQLLAEAGYPGGFSIEVTTWNNMRTEAEAIAASLTNVGVNVTMNFLQSSAAGPMWREGNVPLYLINWGSYGVQDISLSTSHLFGGLTDDQVQDPEVIDALRAGDTAIDRDERLQHYAKALERISEQSYIVPLWTFNINYAMNKDLDFTLDSDEYGRFNNASWK